LLRMELHGLTSTQRLRAIERAEYEGR
jgi:hypothetical protein